MTSETASKMPPSLFVVSDNIHTDQSGDFDGREAALREIRRRALIPWDEEPNLSPCTEWRTCGRVYAVAEYSDQPSRTFIRSTPIVMISAAGVHWYTDGEDATEIAEKAGLWAFHRSAVPRILELARAHAARKASRDSYEH